MKLKTVTLYEKTLGVHLWMENEVEALVLETQQLNFATESIQYSTEFYCAWMPNLTFGSRLYCNYTEQPLETNWFKKFLDEYTVDCKSNSECMTFIKLDM